MLIRRKVSRVPTETSVVGYVERVSRLTRF